MVDDTKPHGITFIKTIIFINIFRETSYLTGIFSGHSLQDENICRYEDKYRPTASHTNQLFRHNFVFSTFLYPEHCCTFST
jgi:hypothetical protein